MSWRPALSEPAGKKLYGASARMLRRSSRQVSAPLARSVAALATEDRDTVLGADAERLLDALQAGNDAGGDRRGVQSAGLLILYPRSIADFGDWAAHLQTG